VQTQESAQELVPEWELAAQQSVPVSVLEPRLVSGTERVPTQPVLQEQPQPRVWVVVREPE